MLRFDLNSIIGRQSSLWTFNDASSKPAAWNAPCISAINYSTHYECLVCTKRRLEFFLMAAPLPRKFNTARCNRGERHDGPLFDWFHDNTASKHAWEMIFYKFLFASGSTRSLATLATASCFEFFPKLMLKTWFVRDECLCAPAEIKNAASFTNNCSPFRNIPRRLNYTERIKLKDERINLQFHY